MQCLWSQEFPAFRYGECQEIKYKMILGRKGFMANNILISPILKWVGGKRQLLADIMPLINKNCSTYVEPFVGGGAVFLSYNPKRR